ncbi:hypothetical protein B5G11_09780 [Drancourtella sp. An57]|uniref:IS66 family insertion sequence element accessory protein TnpB n=1 Tax=Drancourtella sp. An57 TaxID=1965647 RepID=UPI000B399F1F|nr:IS66 family insertion sequence element accessory protein TnpB [Drancourtella sp. An57]OUN69310.1 hypothetical protein B5G11_09780 [Drancourtella sp. An57]
MDKITHQVRAEHWARILNECLNSGMSKTAWCRANGISEKQFFYWQCILRRGIDGLASIVKFNFQLDPYEKDILFLFCGRRSDRIKGLVWEGDGFLLLYKRLELGGFSWPRTKEEALEITPEQYRALMQGLEIVSRHPIQEVQPSDLL